MLERLLKRISKVRQNFQEKVSWLLLHISSAHSARQWWTVSNCGVMHLRHQPYSYALALADLFSFLKVKITLSNWRWLQDVVDSMEKVTVLLNAVPKMTIFCATLQNNTKRVMQSSGFDFGATTPQWARASSFKSFLDHTQLHTTVGRTPLGEWSARRRGLYLTRHITLTTDKHPWRRWDSNPQSQQASGHRPTP